MLTKLLIFKQSVKKIITKLILKIYYKLLYVSCIKRSTYVHMYNSKERENFHSFFHVELIRHPNFDIYTCSCIILPGLEKVRCFHLLNLCHFYNKVIGQLHNIQKLLLLMRFRTLNGSKQISEKLKVLFCRFKILKMGNCPIF